MKTYKREFATLVCLFWAGFCVWAVYDPRALQVVQFITWPCLGLAAGAFGLDAVSKQIIGRGK